MMFLLWFLNIFLYTVKFDVCFAYQTCKATCNIEQSKERKCLQYKKSKPAQGTGCKGRICTAGIKTLTATPASSKYSCP